MPRLLTQRHRQDGKTVRQLMGMLSGFRSERHPEFDWNPVRLIPGIRTLVLSQWLNGWLWHPQCHPATRPQILAGDRPTELLY